MRINFCTQRAWTQLRLAQTVAKIIKGFRCPHVRIVPVAARLQISAQLEGSGAGFIRMNTRQAGIISTQSVRGSTQARTTALLAEPPHRRIFLAQRRAAGPRRMLGAPRRAFDRGNDWRGKDGCGKHARVILPFALGDDARVWQTRGVGGGPDTPDSK
jgi:hypothetical protein